MKRKEFLQKGIAGSALIGSSAWVSASDNAVQNTQEKKVPWDMMWNTRKSGLKER